MDDHCPDCAIDNIAEELQDALDRVMDTEHVSTVVSERGISIRIAGEYTAEQFESIATVLREANQKIHAIPR